MERSEEVILDIKCHAMAFRLLRTYGYEISSDSLAEFDEQENFFNCLSTQFTDTNTILELYKASQIMTSQEEPILDQIYHWTATFLKNQLSNQTIEDLRLHNEVQYALKYPHGSLDRLDNRRTIEQFDVDQLQLLKTAYRCSNVDNRDVYAFSVQDFNILQAIHREELRQLERWVKITRLDHLKFARLRISSSYFSFVAIICSPELSDARISLTENSILITVVDDLFDGGGTREEMINLIELVEKWDGVPAAGYCSEKVEIIFSALFGTINDLAAKALIQQGRCVKHHLIEMWLDVLKCMMKEEDWVREKSKPTLEEYLSNGLVTISLGPIFLISLYFVGSKISEEIVRSAEYGRLYNHMSTIGRLFNDLQTVKKETEQGKLNYLSLLVIQGGGEITEDEGMKETRRIIESNKRQLLSMVLQTKGSMVPITCKDLFWKISKMFHHYYMSSDEYSTPTKILGDMNAIIYDELILPPYLS